MDLFELNGRVVVNLADAVKAFDEIQKEGQKTESKLSKFFSGVGSGAVTVGKWVGTGLAAGGAAMGALTVKAMNLGGELEQNMGGSEAVFKEYATQMQDTAKSAFENMGLSTSDYLGTANKMGALFQGAGFSIEESMKLSSDAMQRAADVASIMGIDTESAMEAVAGAAKGNFTMMDNLGVAMNDTTLNAYALQKGLKKTTQQMTNQEKTALAMEMFMEKTAYATGNYKKENETLAGSLGTAKAALTNFLDGSGDVDSLVDAFSNAADVIIENLGEIAPRLVTGITDIINQIIPLLPPLLQQLLPTIVEGAVSLVNGLVSALPSVLSAVISALPALIQAVQDIITALIQALPTIIETLVAALPTLIPMLVEGLVSMFVMLCEMFSQIIQPIIDILPDILISLLDALLTNLPVLIEGLITLVMGIVEAIPQIIQGLVDALPTIIEMIVTTLIELLPVLIEGAIQLVIGIVTALPQILASLAEALPNAFIGIWNAVKNVFANVGSWFTEKFTGAKEGIEGVFSSIGTWFSDRWQDIKDAFSAVGEWFGEIFSDAWGKVEEAFSAVGEFFGGIWDTITETFTTIGDSIGEAVSNAFSTAINWVLEKAIGIINGFISAINACIGLINKIPGVEISKIAKLEVPQLAEGGVVDKPTTAIFGEDGAEAVVPLENNTGWLNKVAMKLHEFSMQYKNGLGSDISIRSVELQQMQVSELQILNITADKILNAILTLNDNMGGNLREALEGVSLDVNEREFARLVKGTI